MTNQFKREGYTFKGWATTPSGLPEYGDKTTMLVSKDIKLYAVWSPVMRTVSFSGNGGSGSMAAQSVQYGQKAILKANGFSRNGYTFIGWSTSAGGGVVYGNGGVINIKQNITLYAVWQATYKAPSGKVAEGKNASLGIGYGTMSYSSGSHTRGAKFVIRATDPNVANYIVVVAKQLADNKKVGYSKSSGVGPKLYKSMVSKGPTKCSGKASCCPFALCCLKYSLRAYGYGHVEGKINADWRSGSLKSHMNSVRSTVSKNNQVQGFTVITYSSSQFKNWKSNLKAGDIVCTGGHTFVVL